MSATLNNCRIVFASPTKDIKTMKQPKKCKYKRIWNRRNKYLIFQDNQLADKRPTVNHNYLLAAPISLVDDALFAQSAQVSERKHVSCFFFSVRWFSRTDAFGKFVRDLADTHTHTAWKKIAVVLACARTKLFAILAISSLLYTKETSSNNNRTARWELRRNTISSGSALRRGL